MLQDAPISWDPAVEKQPEGMMLTRTRKILHAITHGLMPHGKGHRLRPLQAAT